MWRGRKPRAEARDLAPSPWSSPYASIHHPHPCRVLQLFLSRSAQRGPHLSDGRLLRRLGLLLMLVLGFLVVWTVGALERGIYTPLVARGHTPTGRHFYLCHHDRWDYIMVVGELLLLSPPHSGPLCSAPPGVLLTWSSCLVPGSLAQALPSTPNTERGPMAAGVVPDSLPPTFLQPRCCSCAGAAFSAMPPELYPQPSTSRAIWASPCTMSCCSLLPSTQPGEDRPSCPRHLPTSHHPCLSQAREPHLTAILAAQLRLSKARKAPH